MQVVFHLGAHATDEDRLIRSLSRNPQHLSHHNVVVPHPRHYRMLLRDTLRSLRGASADPAASDALLSAVTQQENVERIVFSHEFFMCVPTRVISDKGFYDMVPDKLPPLANIFPNADIEFYMALINPAVLIPSLVRREKDLPYEDLMNGFDPLDLRWAPIIESMVQTARGHRLVLWCNEDLPLIWPEVMRSLAGLPDDLALNGENMILQSLVSEEGLTRYKQYLRDTPPQSIEERRDITTAFLDKYATENALRIDADMPGWDEDLVDSVTEIYEADIDQIAAMPGVEFIRP
ncbi:hypothetical protein ERN12_01400 [Rhodobacteraceae bacterium]|nr:hypothetical protein ERN12_01400 [Paracoccaceae bacterium]